MPLITICGTPLSGKSHRARQLYDYFQQKQSLNVVLVSDEEKLLELGGPDAVYLNANLEKELRGWLKSEVQRHLALKTTIVILDAANYIKGYRYELNCIVKQLQTTQAVVECESPETLNDENFRVDEDDCQKRKYTRSMFGELIQRYEEPNSSSRWDSPLFKGDPDAETPPFDAIAAALLSTRPAKQNKSTQSQTLTTDNFVQELDNKTQAVIRHIQVAIERHQLKDIKIPDCNVLVDLNRPVPIAELNKLRRQFINYQRLKPVPDEDRKRMTTGFVQFINHSLM